MPIKPFKDRFGKVASCSSPGVSVSVPSFEKVPPKIISSATASNMPQFFQFRQGVSIRTPNQFMRTVIRPVIYAGDVSETDKNTTFNDLHEFRINDFMEFLDRHRFKEFKLHEITAYLKNLGATHAGKKIKGKFTNTWSIPNFQMQTEEFKQPTINKEAYE